MPITLILGGARSGKSRYAEALATATPFTPTYIATAPLIEDDHEWMARINHHRKMRGNGWKLVEEELELTAVLQQHGGEKHTVLVDCLTLWLSNLAYAGRDRERSCQALYQLLPQLQGDIILVANEVGMGLVPESSEGRAFRDAQGRLNQQIAALADRVIFVAAGLPIYLKGASH